MIDDDLRDLEARFSALSAELDLSPRPELLQRCAEQLMRVVALLRLQEARVGRAEASCLHLAERYRAAAERCIHEPSKLAFLAKAEANRNCAERLGRLRFRPKPYGEASETSAPPSRSRKRDTPLR